MKRSSFKQKGYEPRPSRQVDEPNPGVTSPCSVQLLHRGVFNKVEVASTFCVPKVVPVSDEGYRRLVAMLPCMMCGVSGSSQAAHPNTNKGVGTKTDDRLCFPLCCDRPGVQGCHARFDQHALMNKEERRAAEPEFGERTRAIIRAAGLWPKNLPLWEADFGKGEIA